MLVLWVPCSTNRCHYPRRFGCCEAGALAGLLEAFVSARNGPRLVRNPVRLRRASGSDPTRFVGREQELSALRLLYESAQSGRAGFGMVQGPPGMGKTTLLNICSTGSRTRA